MQGAWVGGGALRVGRGGLMEKAGEEAEDMGAEWRGLKQPDLPSHVPCLWAPWLHARPCGTYGGAFRTT